MNAFITIAEASVLEAARDAERQRRGGRVAPLLGVPLAVKDSYLTRGLRTTIGTSVLSTFTSTRDAAGVVAIKEAGGIVFGKNNLVEMSYGLTGLNEHYGQLKNPYDRRHIYVSDEAYRLARNKSRKELRQRLASIAFRQADALVFPTTPCGAPVIENQWKCHVGSRAVTDIFLSRNTHPSSSAGLSGITLPMGLNSEGLPLGLEIDAAAARDRDLLVVARVVERVIGRVPVPNGF